MGGGRLGAGVWESGGGSFWLVIAIPFHPLKQHFVVLKYTVAFMVQHDHRKESV